MNRVLRPASIAKCLAVLVAVLPAGVKAGPVLRIDDAAAAGGTPPSESAVCTLASGAVNTFSFIWTPPEELTSMAWKLPTTSCTACAASGALKLNSVTFRVRWFRACSATAQVSIVGAKQGVTCLEPDPTQVLCGPTTSTITGPGSTNVLHTLPMPAGCCISGNAFLLVRFTGFGACSVADFSPGLAASTAPCTNCEQFVTAANIFPTTTEWCSIGAGNSTWFSVDAECCGATPVTRQSWSAIRTIYR